MTRFLKSLNVNSLVIFMVSGFLCYMQTRVLLAVDRIPVMEQQIQTFKEELANIREQLKREEQERKEADREKDQRLRLMENTVGRMKQP